MKDIDIRTRLKDTYLRKFSLDGSSRIVDELSVSAGDARIDIAVVNGSLHGFEIKSEADSLMRLLHQIEVYSRTFDYLTVVASECHVREVTNRIPDWCGIMVAISRVSSKGPISLKVLRRPKKNKLIDKISVCQLLWKDELVAILNQIGVNTGLNNKSKPVLRQMLADKLDPKELSHHVRTRLKERVNWRADLLPSVNGGL